MEKPEQTPITKIDNYNTFEDDIPDYEAFQRELVFSPVDQEDNQTVISHEKTTFLEQTLQNFRKRKIKLKLTEEQKKDLKPFLREYFQKILPLFKNWIKQKIIEEEHIKALNDIIELHQNNLLHFKIDDLVLKVDQDSFYVRNCEAISRIQINPILRMENNLIFDITLSRKYADSKIEIMDLYSNYKVSSHNNDVVNFNGNLYQVDLIQKYNLQKILFFSKQFFKYHDTLRFKLTDIYNEVYKDDKIILINSIGYIYPNQFKNGKVYKCQLCPNEDYIDIVRIYFYPPHNCRIHLCIYCFRAIKRQFGLKACLSCHEYQLNYSAIYTLRGEKKPNQIKIIK